MDVGAKREGALMHSLDDSVGGMTVFNKGLVSKKGMDCEENCLDSVLLSLRY